MNHSFGRRLITAALTLTMVLAAASAFAQGMSATSGWVYGRYDLTFRKTGASYNATGPRTGIVYRNATQVSTFSDSSNFTNTGTAGTMHFDTTKVFSLADLEDRVPMGVRTGVTTLSSDSVWVFTLVVRPTVNSSVTLSYDSLNVLAEVSFNGGSTWAAPVALMPFIATTGFVGGSAVQLPDLEAQFCTNTAAFGSSSATLTRANFLGLDPPMIRFILVSDLGGQWQAYLRYPRILK